MTPLSLESAIQKTIGTVVRRNGGEIHGNIDYITDIIVTELGGPCYPETIAKFQAHLLKLGLEYLTMSSRVAYFKSMNGELNLVSRDLLEI